MNLPGSFPITKYKYHSSAQKTVYILLYKLLQDFSIFFPFITEEIYQELYHDEKSIHLTKIKELAYTVNPLPFSLLNFVFSFEHLEDENEKKIY